MRRLRSLKLAVGMAVLYTASANANIIQVPGDQPTIQAGINAAVDGDTVLVAGGTYTGTGNRDIDLLGKAILLKSVSGAASTIIDCQGSPADPHRGLLFITDEDSTTVVDGFTITNGFQVEGGGMFCGTSPLIRWCVLTGDSAERGGAMTIGGIPIIENCTISNNASSHVGGALYIPGAAPRLLYCTISENRVWSPDGDWYRGRGGAVYGKVDARFCVFANNWAQHLGGALNSRDSQTFSIVNCTFYGNVAGVNGSCMHFDAGTYPNFINTIVTAHSGSSTLYCWGVANPKFQNCDVWGNSAGDALCGTNLGGNFSQDPLFCDPENGDYRIDQFSPCVGTGVPALNDVGAKGVGCNALIDSSSLLIDPLNGHKYKRYDYPPGFSWHMARDSAYAWGGHLATITSQSEDDLLEAIVYPNISWTVVWCGATDEVTEGNWVWVTGEPFIYSDWHPINFDNQNGIQDYLSLLEVWDDAYSVYPNPYAGAYGNSFIVEWECNCACHADPYCDQQTDIIDVTLAVDVAFRGRPTTYDQSCPAHGVVVDGRLDVDCSGTTDVFDVVKFIDVAFRGDDPTAKFCEPCGQ